MIERIEKDWAFLAYMAGDNDLSASGLKDVMEMSTAGAPEYAYVAVELDTSGVLDGSIRYEITERDVKDNKGYRCVIDRIPEKDSGDPQTFFNFLQWSFGRYRAKKYLVVVWGHGTGFRETKGVGTDWGSHNSLDMRELRNTLEQNRTELTKERRNFEKLAILGFDSCLMAMIEIVYELRGETQFVVGSQQDEYKDGWPYNKVLEGIRDREEKDDKPIAPDALSILIVDTYTEFYKDHVVASATQSAIRTEGIEHAMSTLSGLGQELRKQLQSRGRDEVRAEIKRVRNDVQAFKAADYVDLLDLAEKLASSDLLNSGERVGRVQELAERLWQQLHKKHGGCILESGIAGSGVNDAHGLSVWFPATATMYQEFRSQYVVLDFAKSDQSKGWVQFLDEYF